MGKLDDAIQIAQRGFDTWLALSHELFLRIADTSAPSDIVTCIAEAFVDAEEAKAGRLTGIEMDTIGGNCPVQAEGRIDGKEFYFRARGDSWTMSIGGEDVVGDPEWFIERDYGDGPYAAGWMTEEEARRFMVAAFALFRTETARPAPSSTETTR